MPKRLQLVAVLAQPTLGAWQDNHSGVIVGMVTPKLTCCGCRSAVLHCGGSETPDARDHAKG